MFAALFVVILVFVDFSKGIMCINYLPLKNGKYFLALKN
jgi:hypothetical protein